MTFHNEVRPFITEQTKLLAPTLHESVALGIDSALTRLRGRDMAKYPAQFSGLVRMEVREDLEVRALPDGWTIGGDPRLMAQLLLKHEEQNVVLRFLKENAVNDGRVPHAGSSRLRRKNWANHDIPFDFDFGPSGGRAEPAEATTFLLLWAPIDRRSLDAGFTLRVVHPIEAGEHLRGVTCDMELELRQGGAMFDRLSFTGADESGDLFEVEIAEGLDDQ